MSLYPKLAIVHGGQVNLHKLNNQIKSSNILLFNFQMLIKYFQVIV